MKMYYLDGESVGIDKLRNLAKELEGLEAMYLSDDDVVKVLRCHGMSVKRESVCGSIYSSLQWFRP